MSAVMESNTDPIKIKIVLVGDNKVGKSALILKYFYNRWDDTYAPTVLDVHKSKRKIGAQMYDLEVHDTGGEEHLDFKRAVQYKDADLFIICVATNRRDSIKRVPNFAAEIRTEE